MKVLLAATVLLQLVLQFGPAQSLDPKVNSPCYHSLCAKEIKSQLNQFAVAHSSVLRVPLSRLYPVYSAADEAQLRCIERLCGYSLHSLRKVFFCEFCSVHLLPKESLSVWVPLQTENKDKTVSFECQHGPAECDGNRIQSCVLNHLGNNNPDAHTDFVVCQMKFSAEPTGAKVSEIIVWLPWESRIWKVLWLNISPQTQTHSALISWMSPKTWLPSASMGRLELNCNWKPNSWPRSFPPRLFLQLSTIGWVRNSQLHKLNNQFMWYDIIYSHAVNLHFRNSIKSSRTGRWGTLSLLFASK